MRILRNSGGMANGDAVLMKPWKVTDARLIQSFPRADKGRLALYAGSHDPFNETFGVLGPSEGRDRDSVSLGTVGELKAAGGFVQRLRREILAHRAVESLRHGMSMSGFLVLGNLRRVTGSAGGGGQRR